MSSWKDLAHGLHCPLLSIFIKIAFCRCCHPGVQQRLAPLLRVSLSGGGMLSHADVPISIVYFPRS